MGGCCRKTKLLAYEASLVLLFELLEAFGSSEFQETLKYSEIINSKFLIFKISYFRNSEFEIIYHITHSTTPSSIPSTTPSTTPSSIPSTTPSTTPPSTHPSTPQSQYLQPLLRHTPPSCTLYQFPKFSTPSQYITHHIGTHLYPLFYSLYDRCTNIWY
jgi:hypothetical protein